MSETQKAKRKLRNLRYRQKQKSKANSEFTPSKLEDLNAVGDKKFSELRGFEEAFQGSNINEVGEDRKGFFCICPSCGSPLEKDGSCSNKCCE